MTYDDHVDCDDEIAQLQTENSQLSVQAANMSLALNKLEVENTQLQAENKRLRKALKQGSQMDGGCDGEIEQVVEQALKG